MIRALLVLLTIALTQQVYAQHEHHQAAHQTEDHVSVHGMMIFGDSKVYLSHLPMFHSPHDYQAVIEADFDQQALIKYLAAKKVSAETVYTLVPESFVLPEMIANPRPFKATIYQGHFERGGQPIATVTVNLKKTIYFKKFDPSELKPQEEKYIFIENAQEKFSVHVITAKPDFDEIARIEKDGIKSILYFETGDLSH